MTNCDPTAFYYIRVCFVPFPSALPTGHLKSVELVTNRHASSYQIEVILKLFGNGPRLGEDSSIWAAVTGSWPVGPGVGLCAVGGLHWGPERVSAQPASSGLEGGLCWPRVHGGGVGGTGLGWSPPARGPGLGGPGLERRAVAGRASEEEAFWSGAHLDLQAGEMRNAREEAGTLGAGAAQAKERKRWVQLRRVWRAWPNPECAFSLNILVFLLVDGYCGSHTFVQSYSVVF